MINTIYVQNSSFTVGDCVSFVDILDIPHIGTVHGFIKSTFDGFWCIQVQTPNNKIHQLDVQLHKVRKL